MKSPKPRKCKRKVFTPPLIHKDVSHATILTNWISIIGILVVIGIALHLAHSVIHPHGHGNTVGSSTQPTLDDTNGGGTGSHAVP